MNSDFDYIMKKITKTLFCVLKTLKTTEVKKQDLTEIQISQHLNALFVSKSGRNALALSLFSYFINYFLKNYYEIIYIIKFKLIFAKFKKVLHLDILSKKHIYVF